MKIPKRTAKTRQNWVEPKLTKEITELLHDLQNLRHYRATYRSVRPTVDALGAEMFSLLCEKMPFKRGDLLHYKSKDYELFVRFEGLVYNSKKGYVFAVVRSCPKSKPWSWDFPELLKEVTVSSKGSLADHMESYLTSLRDSAVRQLSGDTSDDLDPLPQAYVRWLKRAQAGTPVKTKSFGCGGKDKDYFEEVANNWNKACRLYSSYK